MDNIETFAKKYDRATLTDVVASTNSIFFEKKNPAARNGLRKKLTVSKQEQQELEDTIAAKNNEIDDLKKSISSLNKIINFVPIEDLKNTSYIASVKIAEFIKKNRLLQADLDSVRNKNSQLETKVNNLETELKKSIEKKEIVSSKTDNTTEGLKSKLGETKQKLFDSLNLNVELKKQLKLAQKCIQQEIGENINLNILAASGTNWRGRAQQIMGLQLKINELRDQLESVRSESSWSCDCPEEPPVRREYIHRRVEIEVLQKDSAAFASHIEVQNHKIAALKARNTNLVADVAKLKEKVVNLEALVASNDSTLQKLNDKLNVQKIHYESRIRELQNKITDIQKERNDFGFHKEEMNVKLENLQTAIDSRENHIADLNSTIKKLERDLKSVCGDYLFECRDFNKDEFLALLGSLECEKNNLLELNKTINNRLDTERSSVLSLTDQISKQKMKICRLEGKIRDFEKHIGLQTEKKKRSQKISEYANSVSNNSRSVTSFVFENTFFTDIPSNSGDGEFTNFERIGLRNKLEVAEEKITILEEKINYLNKEKQNDAETFENIIKMSKSILLDTIHQIKDETLQ